MNEAPTLDTNCYAMKTIESHSAHADPVISEVRASKRAIVAEHGGDLESFFAGIRRRQSSNPRLVTSIGGIRSTVDYLRHRAERANLRDFDRLLALVPNSEPDPGDELLGIPPTPHPRHAPCLVAIAPRNGSCRG